MPQFSPVLYPPFNIIRLSYVELEVSNLEASGKFYSDLLGLVVTVRSSNQLFLRCMEEREHHSIVLTRGSTPQCRGVGFKAFDERDLVGIENYFKERGHAVDWIEKPHLGKVLKVRDNHGMPLEFYCRMDLLPTIHQKYQFYKGAKPLRIDHVNMFSTDVDSSAEFYNNLGFRLTEYTEDEESGRMWAAWLHRKGTVHDVAFTNGRGPRLHHVAFFLMNPLNIIDLLDVMSTSGYLGNIERGPGRHGISNAFFLYIRDPDNHRIELYCCDYQTIDPDHEPIKWDLKDPTRQTLWGQPAPRSWFEEGSLFEGAEVKEPLQAGTPIVAP